MHLDDLLPTWTFRSSSDASVAIVNESIYLSSNHLFCSFLLSFSLPVQIYQETSLHILCPKFNNLVIYAMSGNSRLICSMFPLLFFCLHSILRLQHQYSKASVLFLSCFIRIQLMLPQSVKGRPLLANRCQVQTCHGICVSFP